MNILTYFAGLRPAIPFSAEQGCKDMSNGELRRHIQNGSVLINHERVTVQEQIDFPVFSVVFFPNSVKRKTTLV